MHIGSLDANGNCTMSSKTEAMYFLVTPKTPAELDVIKTDLIFGDNNKFYIPFMDCFGCCSYP